MNNLALVLMGQGELQEARQLHEQTLETRRRILGAEHRGTLASMNNLAVLLKDQGELDEARKLLVEHHNRHPRTTSSIAI